ncbi:MAG: CRISPR-associated helicase Cas3' [Spirochaetes bacterium]|jgi:CRISPR-associated endonuclease/helicase Cas3|nr:CRISPR-associated helicase Cas3' [Spirochaetota bacterium]
MNYYAHTKENEPKEKWQLLKDHLTNVSDIAINFARSFNGEKHAKIAGLLHDLGKYQKEFQNYLEHGGARGSVPHAIYGALLTGAIFNQKFKVSYKEISYVIDGHHSGLPDNGVWSSDHMSSYDNNRDTLNQLVKTFLTDTEIDQNILKDIQDPIEDKDVLERELFTRLLFSCITDADWLDTEKFMSPKRYAARKNHKIDIKNMISKMDTIFKRFSSEGNVNKLRNAVRIDALEKSNMKPGFFSLNLPTGMGKTLTSLYWALHHAQNNNMDRVIVVLPFISIIDQTAVVLKDLFGEENVLEHHSNIAVDNESFDENSYNYRRLACENWDYPVIITTTVQFFESLFSNRPSKCRKVHNIVNSVVVFDEIQTLPKEMIQPTLSMLKNIHALTTTSFLFCTATMPAYEKREGFDGISKLTELVNNPEEIFESTKRVDYKLINNLEPVENHILVDQIESSNKSVLVIFNTKKAAGDFFQLCLSEKWTYRQLLTTNLCPDHRKKVISEIRRKLTDINQKILIVSTQLIEAGVDFDFPLVYRAIAPLESIIQSAGRCNREGKLSNLGSVYIFVPENNKMPEPTYSTCASHAKNLIRKDAQILHSYETFSEYYRSIIELYINPDTKNIDADRKSYNFKTVSDKYKLIENETELLFIKNYNSDSEKLYQQIENTDYLSQLEFRQVQQYSIQVYPQMIKNYSDIIYEIKPGLKVWLGGYNNENGIVYDNKKSDNYVV